jgi:hypothetical protein
MFPLVYYIFDLLFLEGKDLRKLLANLLKKNPVHIGSPRSSAGLKTISFGSPRSSASRA